MNNSQLSTEINHRIHLLISGLELRNAVVECLIALWNYDFRVINPCNRKQIGNERNHRNALRDTLNVDISVLDVKSFIEVKGLSPQTFNFVTIRYFVMFDNRRINNNSI